MRHRLILSIFLIAAILSSAQLPVARDTLTVLENGKVLRMPWANGINYANASNMDVNNDNVKDLVIFDRVNQFGTGRFRCFIKTGTAGQAKYRSDPGLSYYFPQCANWAVLMDFNCDGREDLFCSVNSGIKVYKNTSGSAGISFTLFKSLLYTDYGGANGISNLYASSIGVPGIADIDNDGDLDVLTFSPQGVLIELHKNMSKEMNYNCDSLVFKATDLCWGKISESQCAVTMNQCLSKPIRIEGATGEKAYHAGSCLMCMDSDGDADQDLIMGDVSCNTIHYVHNTGSPGSAYFTDTTALYPSYPVKSSSAQIRINNFPCTYYVDVDGDNKRDLLAMPNVAGTENYKSVWYYRNSSSTSTVNFQFVQNNFLQDEMIEVGQDAFPLLFDYDSDGKKDLLIGTFGYYQNSSLNARLTLYRNISASAVPVYSLITRDYAGLSAQNLSYVMPAAGDMDGDGDMDLLIGTLSGQVHWLKNSAGPGQVCNFSQFLPNPFTFTTSSAVAAPHIIDLNGDNLLDLVIGTKNGRLSYYRNTGTASVPAFSLITNYLGNVDVKGDPYLFGLDGYAVPYFYRDNGNLILLVGSISGAIWQYSVPANLQSPFSLLYAGLNGLNEGSQSAPLFEDLDGDGKRDLMLGNASGGLAYFSSSSPYVGVREEKVESLSFSLYPNPAGDLVYFQTETTYQEAQVTLCDTGGRKLLSKTISPATAWLDLAGLAPGIYLLNISKPESANGQQQHLKLVHH